MAKGKQSAEGIDVEGRFKQSSDVSSTDQSAANVNASSFSQEIGSRQSGIQLGRYRAVGLTGVVALLIIVLGWFILSYVTR